MEKPLRDLRKQLTLLTVVGWAIAPLTAYVIALFYGMLHLESFAQPKSLLLIATYLLLMGWVISHFYHFLTPLQSWLKCQPYGGNLPDSLIQHIKAFTGNYWSFHLLAIFLLPTLQHWLGLTSTSLAPTYSLLNLMLLQLVVSILVGMPSFLLALSIHRHLAATVQHEIQDAAHRRLYPTADHHHHDEVLLVAHPVCNQ